MGSIEKTNAALFVGTLPFNLSTTSDPLAGSGYHKVLIKHLGDNTPTDSAGYDCIQCADIHARDSLDQAIQVIQTTYRIAVVVGLSEVGVLAAAYITEKTGAAGIPMSVAMACRNKHTMLQALSDLPQHIPKHQVCTRTTEVAEIEANCGPYPLVCKPLLGFASKGVTRVDDAAQLAAALRQISRDNKFTMQPFYDLLCPQDSRKVLVESFVDGREFAVDGIVINQQITLLQRVEKPDVSNGPYFPDSIHISPARISAAEQLIIDNVARQAVTAVGLVNGPFHLEMRLNGQQATLIEIAARIGFPRLLRLSTGIDIVALATAAQLGSAVAPKVQATKYAGNLCILPPRTGFFQGVTNLQQLRDDPYIEELLIFVAPGDRVSPPPNGNGYIGFAIVSADSYDAVAQSLYKIRDSIDVVITDTREVAYEQR